MGKIHSKGGPALREGPDICRVPEHFRKGCVGLDNGDLVIVNQVCNLALPRIEIPDNIA